LLIGDWHHISLAAQLFHYNTTPGAATIDDDEDPLFHDDEPFFT
jgi:hypothetical protein